MLGSRQLFIIGNGFDLHHGYHTSYKDFRNYLEHRTYEVGQYNLYDFFSDVSEDEWNNFESSLEYIRFDDNMSWFDPHLSDDMSDIEWDREFSRYSGFTDENIEIVSSQTVKKALKYSLNAFIRKETSKLKPASEVLKKIFAKGKDSLYITFNYSHTLEKVYGIEQQRILHIHGETEDYYPLYDHHGVWEGYGESSLIFGHGGKNNGDTSKLVYDEDYYNPLKPGKAFSLLNDQFCKEYQVDEMKEFIGDNYINDIIIIGHSLGDIDRPYFDELSNIIHQGRVVYYIYDEREEENIRETLNYYFKSNKIELRDYRDNIVQ